LIKKLKKNQLPQFNIFLIHREVCNLKFSAPQEVEKPLKTKWCLDSTPSAPGETYDESEALGAPLAAAASENSPSFSPLPAYGAQPQYQGSF
jgi:hypothetical protein